MDLFSLFDLLGIAGDFSLVGDTLDMIGFDLADIAAANWLYKAASVVYAVFCIVILLVMAGFTLTKMAHKMDVSGYEGMAYFPFVNDFYKTHMVGMHPALTLFIGFTGVVMSLVVAFLVGAVFKSFLLVVVVYLAYSIACLYFNYLFHKQLFCRFGFEREFALLYFVPGAGKLILVVFELLIAFSNLFDTNMRSWVSSEISKINGIIKDMQSKDSVSSSPEAFTPQSKVKVIGMSGKYAGSSFSIAPGETITFGRDTTRCNITYSSGDKLVSRIHCSVRYAAQEGAFYVTDSSSNGTFTGEGVRLPNGQPKRLPTGSMICLGDRSNSFRLG